MASFIPRQLLCLGVSVVLFVLLPVALCGAGGAAPLTHHGGRLLTGNLNIGILWYGPIPAAQRKAILSFLGSLNPNGGANATQAQAQPQPQVSSWWNIVESYQAFAKKPAAGIPRIQVKVISEQYDPNYSLGKVLIKDFIKMLLPKATGGKPNTLALIIAPRGVTVQDMCAGSCAQHGLIGEQAYVAVGNPEEECPECAWPFLRSASRNLAQGATVKPPSGDVGADSMVMLLAGGLAGAVTNPYGDGFYVNGPGGDPIEATSKCPAIFARGPLLVDPTNGGAFNAHGAAGAKFLLPALWNPKSSSCWTPL